jgi:hypothetical protein
MIALPVPRQNRFEVVTAIARLASRPRLFGLRVTELGFVWPVVRSLDDVRQAMAAIGIEVPE